MRKFLYFISCMTLCTSIFLTLIFSSHIAVNANVEYRRIITQDTPFYSDASGTDLLFNLPYTYYVRLLEQGEAFSHVECFGTGKTIAIDGYVPTDKLFDDSLPVQSPYLEKEITTISTAVLYANKSLTTPLQYLFASRTLIYYGQIQAEDGSILFYVGYNDRLGYVKESQIMPFETPQHPNELTFIKPEIPTQEQTPTESEQPTSNDNLLTIRIIVIACLLLAGLVALFIAVKNKPKRQLKSSYYDENEYE